MLVLRTKAASLINLNSKPSLGIVLFTLEIVLSITASVSCRENVSVVESEDSWDSKVVRFLLELEADDEEAPVSSPSTLSCKADEEASR